MIGLTFFRSLTTPQGRRVELTWPAFIARPGLTKPLVTQNKHSAPGISLATYRDDYRKLENVERVYAVGLDFDKRLAEVGWGELTRLFDDTDSFAHTTWQSTPEMPRARVFLRLSRPVTGDEYRRCYAAVAERCEGHGLVIDRAAADPSRFWFLPSTPPGGSYAYSVGRGKPVNVDWALATVPAVPPAPAMPIHRAPRESDNSSSQVEERAAKYVDRCEPAISGSGGHTTTFLLAQKLVLGFALGEETAYRLMLPWNARCSPPWSERELRRKLQQAAERGRMQEGALRDAPRRAS